MYHVNNTRIFHFKRTLKCKTSYILYTQNSGYLKLILQEYCRMWHYGKNPAQIKTSLKSYDHTHAQPRTLLKLLDYNWQLCYSLLHLLESHAESLPLIIVGGSQLFF